MTFGRLGWRDNFQEKLNGTPERRWRKNFLTSFSKIFLGPKSSQNGEVWFGLDDYIVCHPSRCIWSGKSGGISSRDHFYRRDPIWKNKVWNLPRVFWGIKWCFLGVKNCRFSITPSHAILHTDIFPMTQEARQLESVCKIYATQKLTFLFSHL